jgi:hypothetical protein
MDVDELRHALGGIVPEAARTLGRDITTDPGR